MFSKTMCGNKYKYDMIEEQFSLDNFVRADEHIDFIGNVYGGIIEQGKCLCQFCRPLETQPKAVSPKKTEELHRNGNNAYGIY